MEMPQSLHICHADITLLQKMAVQSCLEDIYEPSWDSHSMPTETVFRQLPRLPKRGAVGTHTHTHTHDHPHKTKIIMYHDGISPDAYKDRTPYAQKFRSLSTRIFHVTKLLIVPRVGMEHNEGLRNF